MSEPEIEQFIIVFKSFMDHASVEELNYLQREAKREYNCLLYKSTSPRD